jgi:hypothetical protein
MWWDPWRNNNGMNGYEPFIPFFFNRNDFQNNLKDGSESYHVYVNNDYVGDKEILTQGEGGPAAVESYLKSRGFEDYQIQTEGDHIKIQTDHRDQADDMKKHLSVYLSIR